MSDLGQRWALRLVAAFADAGVREVVVSPGSRSTPLVVAALADRRLRVHVVIDERSAAFFALGIARATSRPPLFVCTSGTAGAHALPAVIEASSAGHPLVVLTADRPVELRDCAAPQTVDQLRLFGGHVRSFVELGAPDPAALGALGRIAAQSVLATCWPRPGAVHVNAAFRKPLEPADDGWRNEVLGPATPVLFAPRQEPSPEAVELVAGAVSASERGVIAVGALPAGADTQPIAALAARSGLPLFAETTSQLRTGVPDAPACPGFDTFLRSPELRRAHEPDLLLELGLPLLSPAWASWIALHPRCRRIAVAPQGLCDPHGGLSAMVIADPAALAEAVTARLGSSSRSAAAWREAFAAADRVVWEEVERELGAREDLVDGAVARAVLEALPDGSLLQLGASLPLRDVDAFSRGPRARVTVLHPRGANGIDGLVASAAGAQAATGRPTTLLCGDVSLLHDLGSLVTARGAAGPLVIVVVHNDGGRIFEELPLASSTVSPRDVARAWTTPHGLSFGPAATFAGLAHAKVGSARELAQALSEAYARPGATLVEAVVDGPAGSASRRRIRAAVCARLGGAA